MSRKYSEEQFVEAWNSSLSVRQVLDKLGLKAAGGNYSCANNYAKELNLTKDHMKGQGWNKGKTFTPRRPLEEYFSNKFGIQSNKLRQRLIKEGYKEHKCEICGIMEWNGQPTPLELDHIDGNHHNNTLDNLRVICPNCHAQTDNYRGKNKGR